MLRVALSVCAVLFLAGGAGAQGRPVCKDSKCSGLTSGYSTFPTYQTFTQSAPLYAQPYQSAPVVIPSGKAVSAAAAWSGCTCSPECLCAAQAQAKAATTFATQPYTQASYAAFSSGDGGGSCGQSEGYGAFGRQRKHPVLSRVPFLRRLVHNE